MSGGSLVTYGLAIYRSPFSGCERKKCSLDPNLAYGIRSLPQRWESNSKSWIIYVVSHSPLRWSFYFWTTRTNRHTGVFLESPGVKVGRTFSCCLVQPLQSKLGFWIPHYHITICPSCCRPIFPPILPHWWMVLTCEIHYLCWWDKTVSGLCAIPGKLTLSHAFNFPLKVNQ